MIASRVLPFQAAGSNAAAAHRDDGIYVIVIGSHIQRAIRAKHGG